MPTPDPDHEDRRKAAAPKLGQRFVDKDQDIYVTYIGDSDRGPWWRADDGDTFYCDWHDFYTWNRFEVVRTPEPITDAYERGEQP